MTTPDIHHTMKMSGVVNVLFYTWCDGCLVWWMSDVVDVILHKVCWMSGMADVLFYTQCGGCHTIVNYNIFSPYIRNNNKVDRCLARYSPRA